MVPKCGGRLNHRKRGSETSAGLDVVVRTVGVGGNPHAMPMDVRAPLKMILDAHGSPLASTKPEGRSQQASVVPVRLGRGPRKERRCTLLNGEVVVRDAGRSRCRRENRRDGQGDA